MQSILSKMVGDIKNRLSNTNNLKKAGLNWFKLRQLKYSPFNTISTHNLKGKKIYFKNRAELIHSLREIFIEEIYKMKADATPHHIIDCGANIGLSVLYMKEQFPNAKVLAFEPDALSFPLLQKNTNGMTGIVLKQKAVWKDNTTINFDNTGTLSSRIVTNPFSNQKEAKIVEAERLRDYLDKPIFFLKLDIEGAEYEVIKDCADRLGMAQNIFLEYHGRFDQINELTEIFTLLRENDFYYYIKEAAPVYSTPFFRESFQRNYDIQLNIFCFKNI